MKQKPAPQAQDFMTRNVPTVSPDMLLADVIDVLNRNQVSNAPVVEPMPDGGLPKLVGFVSEGDCLEHLANEIFFDNPVPARPVRAMMKPDPVSVAPTADIFTVASALVQHRYRCLPVADEGRLVGVIRRRDILKALNTYNQQAGKERDFEMFPPDLHELGNMRFVSK